jgi:hypothetical protein
VNRIKSSLQRYWRWTTGGPKWRLLAGAGGPILALLIIIGAVTGGGSTEKDRTGEAPQVASPELGQNPPESEVEEPTDTPRPTQIPKPTVTPEPSQVPSNQAKIGNLLLTINGTKPHSDDLFPAEAGTHYVAVDITAENAGSGTYALNVNNFRLKDSEGFTANPALTSGPEPRIGHHDMVPGQEVRGYLVFKLGNGRNPVELQYQSFTGTPGTIPIR